MSMKDMRYYYGFTCNASHIYTIWKKLFPDDDSLFLDLKQLERENTTIRMDGFLLVISSFITRKSEKPIYFVAFKLYEFIMNRLVSYCNNSYDKEYCEKLLKPYLPKNTPLKNFTLK